MAHSMKRPPSRSPSTPKSCEVSVPANCREAKRVRSRTEPVCTMTNHPRIRVSISKAHEVRRSAGSWKRKLRTRKTLRINGRGFSSSRRRGSDAAHVRATSLHQTCYDRGHLHVSVPRLLRLVDHRRLLL